MALSARAKRRLEVSMAHRADAAEIVAAIETPRGEQAAAVANEATANGTDPTTTMALANALKVKLNALLTAMRTAGLLAP